MNVQFPQGQGNIAPSFLDILNRTAEAFGAPLRVTSGMQGRSTRPGSMHPRGNAVDLDMSGMDDAQRARLLETLRTTGAMRFGTYDRHPNMLHVDMSNAQGGNWFMHNTSNRNLAAAPEWMRTAAENRSLPDVRMAANTAGSTDTDRTPSGDPVTGRMIPMLQPFTMAPPAPEAPAETDWLQPLVALIGGAAMSGGGGLGRAVQLAGGGMAAAQTAENELLELKQKRADAARKRQGQDALDRYADQLSQNPATAEIGAMIRMDPSSGMRYYAETRKAQMEQQAAQSYAQQLKAAGATDYQIAQAMAGQNPGQQDKPEGPEEYFAPVAMVDPNDPTRVYMAQFSKTGQPRAWKPGPGGQWVPADPAEAAGTVPAPGAAAPGAAAPGAAVPAGVWGKMPATAGQIQTAKDTAKNDVEAKEGYTEAIAAIDKGRNTIARLAQMPGRTSATGWQAGLPYTWPGGEASNYEVLFDQFKGENFLAAIPQMRGMGALSNAEGDALRQAQSYAQTNLSDEEHEWALATAYANLNRAEQRIKTRKLLGSGEDPPAASQKEIEVAADALFGPGRAPGAGLKERRSNPKFKAKITEIP